MFRGTDAGTGTHATDVNGTVSLPAPEGRVNVTVTATDRTDTAEATIMLYAERKNGTFGAQVSAFVHGLLSSGERRIGHEMSAFATANTPGTARDRRTTRGRPSRRARRTGTGATRTELPLTAAPVRRPTAGPATAPSGTDTARTSAAENGPGRTTSGRRPRGASSATRRRTMRAVTQATATGGRTAETGTAVTVRPLTGGVRVRRADDSTSDPPSPGVDGTDPICF